MRATCQPARGGPGRSQANGPDARRGLEPPAATSTMINATTPRPTAESPITARVRPIALHVSVAVARPAVVVGVAIAAAVLPDPAFGRRLCLRRGPRPGRRRNL